MKKKGKKVLLCFEKYCDFNPDMKLSNSYHNFLNTFSSSCPDYIFHAIHYDEAQLVYGKSIDEVLVDYCSKWKIDVILFILLGPSETVNVNPSLNTLKKLKEMGIYLCFNWPDTGPGWGSQTIKSLEGYSDLHISWDRPRSPYHDSFPFPKTYETLWPPQDPNLYYKQSEQKIGVSFVGSSNSPDRQHFLNYAKRNYPDLLICGGQREECLSPEEYANTIRSSKIGINFSISLAGFYQLKGRVLEIAASCSMLLELKNPSTAGMFEPGKDYVEFESQKELVDKIRYYTEHEEERSQIALNGHNKYKSSYTAFHFWKKIMDRIESETSK